MESGIFTMISCGFYSNFPVHNIHIESISHINTWLRDRSLFMTGGGGPGSNDFLQEHFSRPTHHAMENFRGPLDIARQFLDAHSWCKIFMYFRIELICKLCRFDCNSEVYRGLTKDAKDENFYWKIFRCPLVASQDFFDAHFLTLKIFSMPPHFWTRSTPGHK